MTIPVWFVTLPGVMMLGPAETFRLAGEAFALRYIGADSSVTTSVDMVISQIEPLPEKLPDGSLLVIPGVCDSGVGFDTPQALSVCHWLMRMQPAIHAGRVTLVCICSGTLLAARAGLMRGVQCTTHHDVIGRLKAAEPDAIIKENRIFIEDRGIWTSAGISTGIDLTLHLINRLCGAQTALAVAREMVIWFRRSGDDPQLSPWLRFRNHLHPALHRAQDTLTLQPQRAWSLAEIAATAHVSPRHLTRLFRQHLGISVHDYHQQLQLALAQQHLQLGDSFEKAALAAGFSSARQMRRAQQREQLTL